MATSCPYYFGEETTMRDPNDREIKRFNPVFDMKAFELFPTEIDTASIG